MPKKFFNKTSMKAILASWAVTRVDRHNAKSVILLTRINANQIEQHREDYLYFA